MFDVYGLRRYASMVDRFFNTEHDQLSFGTGNGGVGVRRSRGWGQVLQHRDHQRIWAEQRAGEEWGCAWFRQ